MSLPDNYDVLVIGGGVAGVAAALECARRGLSTALVEKTVLWGGLATTGFVNIYLPLCDGRGRQVMFGLAEELLLLSLKYGPGNIPKGWTDPALKPEQARYRTLFSPAAFVLAMDEALEAAKVTPFLDALACVPVLEGDRVAGVELEDKSGRRTLRARAVIDASGDADIAHRAGAPCIEGTNYLSLWAMEYSLKAARAAIERGDTLELTHMRAFGANDAGGGAPAGARTYRGITGEDVTDFVMTGRRYLRDLYRKLQSETPGGVKEIAPAALPSMAQYRMTRRIDGFATVASADHDRKLDGSIGLTGDWKRSGILWEIPYGTLVPRRVKGLLVAGRCLAAEEGDAWNALRVIPPAALTGQVAGVASALALAKKTTADALEPEVVRAELRRLGWPLHIDELPPLKS